MKKKLSILLASLASISVLVTSFLLMNENMMFSPIGGKAFELDQNGIDVKKEAVVTNKSGASVNTTFFDATLDDDGIFIESNNYVIWSNDEDSPIRGIDSVSIYTDLGSSYVKDYIDVVIYTSFNHLNFEDIQFGKYDDLNTQGMLNYYYSSLGVGNFKCDISEENARYFLMVICSKIDVHITDVTITSICEDEPSGSEVIGEFDHYRADELEVLPNDFPFIGNGAYESLAIPEYSVDFYISGLKGNVYNFRYSLVEYGYSLVDVSEDIHNTYTYQKPNPDSASVDDKYFTLRITEGDEYDDFVFNENIKYYAYAEAEKRPDYKNNTWPSESIGEDVGNDGYQSIASDPCIPVNGFTYLYNGGMAHARFENKDEETLQAILNSYKTYKTRFEDLGFILTYESNYDHSKEPYIDTINIELYAPKLDYRLLFIYEYTPKYDRCDVTFEFRRCTAMDVTAFNEELAEESIPGITTESMKFVENNPYYSSPIKVSDLYTYADVLKENEITVTSVNKYGLVSDKITFTRYKNSLNYKISF